MKDLPTIEFGNTRKKWNGFWPKESEIKGFVKRGNHITKINYSTDSNGDLGAIQLQFVDGT